MDLSELLNWFIVLSSTIDQTAHEYLVIIDNYDNVLAGPTGDTDFIGEAQFRYLLPNLRLKINSQHQADNAKLYNRQFVLQILPIFVAALLGILALIVRNKADRQDKKLRQRQTEFAARVTHELKTPLAGIRLMAENLEMGAIDDPDLAKNFAVRIVEESDKLAARVEEILLIARSTTVEPTTPIDLFDLMAELTDEWEPRFDDAGIELRVEMNESAVILGDPPILRDAITNLLDNALKYRAPKKDSFVEVSLVNIRREAVIKICDNGLGVPANMQRVIFERFARVEGPQRGKSGGHGLGLSFTNETITSHLGTIECRPNANGGACFIVRLPVASRAVTDKLLES
jgi:two-component system phosphate regulon sensor histidine kinase PhoR